MQWGIGLALLEQGESRLSAGLVSLGIQGITGLLVDLLAQRFRRGGSLLLIADVRIIRLGKLSFSRGLDGVQAGLLRLTQTFNHLAALELQFVDGVAAAVAVLCRPLGLILRLRLGIITHLLFCAGFGLEQGRGAIAVDGFHLT